LAGLPASRRDWRDGCHRCQLGSTPVEHLEALAEAVGRHGIPPNNSAQRIPANRLLVPRSMALMMWRLVAVICAACPRASSADRRRRRHQIEDRPKFMIQMPNAVAQSRPVPAAAAWLPQNRLRRSSTNMLKLEPFAHRIRRRARARAGGSLEGFRHQLLAKPMRGPRKADPRHHIYDP